MLLRPKSPIALAPTHPIIIFPPSQSMLPVYPICPNLEIAIEAHPAEGDDFPNKLRVCRLAVAVNRAKYSRKRLAIISALR